MSPTGWNRTRLGFRTSISPGKARSGWWWHWPHMVICWVAVSRSLPNGILSASADPPLRAAATCSRPGPWQRSHETFGVISARTIGVSGPATEVRVVWQFRQRNESSCESVRP